jgi:hypothetical protein
MAIIQTHLGYRKALGKHGGFAGPLLDPILLDKQSFFLKLTLQNNCQAVMLPPHDYNPTTQLWGRFASSAIVSQWLSKWFKLVQLYMVMIIGNVEDERTCSNLSFMKNKLCNYLTTRLDLVVRMYAQSFYSLETFPFYTTICDLNEHHTWHELNA